jgi:hypothetical protein
MIRLTAAGIALCAITGLSASQTYRWVDERGVTNYGEKPPTGRRAEIVDTQPGGTLESGPILQPKPRTAEQKTETAGAPPEPAPVRGMDFNIFIKLEVGMSEGELLLRAGPPDQESVENFRNNVVKSYYYYPTAANPFITLVTLRGGRITNIERTKKTF